ncbi:MAG: hypothetical protein M1457_05570 [bacterium]|nr:hypothetical protein [bacterium]
MKPVSRLPLEIEGLRIDDIVEAIRWKRCDVPRRRHDGGTRAANKLARLSRWFLEEIVLRGGKVQCAARYLPLALPPDQNGESINKETVVRCVDALVRKMNVLAFVRDANGKVFDKDVGHGFTFRLDRKVASSLVDGWKRANPGVSSQSSSTLAKVKPDKQVKPDDSEIYGKKTPGPKSFDLSGLTFALGQHCPNVRH